MRCPVDLLLLGPVQLWLGGRRVALGVRQQRLMLAVLALEVNGLVPVERLVDLLWDQAPPRSARAIVHTHVSKLRSVLADLDGVELITEGAAYALWCEPSMVDAHRFRVLVALARDETSDERKVALLTEAGALWRGPALADVADTLLRERLCGGLQETRLTAMEDRVDALLRLGRHRALVAELTTMVAEHPHRHRLVGQLMVALHRCGRTGDALAVYDDARRRSVEQLGLDPDVELQRLHTAILRRRPVPGEIDRERQIEGAGRGDASMSRRHAYLPADVPDFTGRERELGRMVELSRRIRSDLRPGPVLVAVIDGMAGIGKTALVVHFGHHASDAFPDGQIFIDLHGFTAGRQPISPAAALDRLLRAAGVPGDRIPAELEDRAALWRATLAGRRTLVVLDNAADEDQVRPLLPGTGGCLVLVTSRRRLPGLDGARPLPLDFLPEADAVALFERVVGDRQRTGDQPHLVAEVIELCGRLPLAIRLAAARLATRPAWTMAHLRDRLGGHRYRLAELHAGHRSLTATLEVSYEHLPIDQQELFRLLSLHPGPDFEAHAAAALTATTHQQADRLLDGLLHAHLLMEPAAGRYRLHDLVWEYATNLVNHTESATDRDTASRRLLESYLRTAHCAALVLDPHREPLIPHPPAPLLGDTPDPADAVAWFNAEHQALLTLVQRAAAAGHDSHAWQLAWTLVTFLDRRGSWSDQLTTQLAARNATRRLGDPGLQAYFERTIGFVHTRLSNFDKAMTHYHRALQHYRQVGDNGGQAEAHRAIALALEHRGDLPQALDHAERSLALSRTIDEPPLLATALNATGWLRALLGEHHDALRFCEQALTIYQNIDHRGGEAHTWDSLGYIHHHLGHHAQAAHCYQRAIDGLQELGERYNLAEILLHLGQAQHATGQTTAAHQSWRRAIVILDDFHHLDADRLRARIHGFRDSDPSRADPGDI